MPFSPQTLLAVGASFVLALILTPIVRPGSFRWWPEQWRQTFVYDSYGNRTIDPAQSSGGVNEKAFTIDTGTNRLGVPVGQTGVMQYEATGNLTNDTYTGAGNRTYDAENKIVSAWGGNNQAQLYGYDASGNRIKRTVDGVETWQVYGLGGEWGDQWRSEALRQ